MIKLVEYHVYVRKSISASLLGLSLLALPAVLISSSHAQINGAPASVTSPGFGGHAINGTPASVTSLGPRGFAPNPQITFTTPQHVPHRVDSERRHHHSTEFTPPFLYAVPVPYAVENSASEDYTDGGDSDPNYQGGPTVFDRRGSGARSYVPPVSDVAPSRQSERADSSPEGPEAANDPTLLVFKDGRKLEVGNYAIVGATLFDLTPGHSRKVAVADLDLEATRKQNDDRGIVFQLPPSLRAN
jgi:hypothetical protein